MVHINSYAHHDLAVFSQPPGGKYVFLSLLQRQLTEVLLELRSDFKACTVHKGQLSQQGANSYEHLLGTKNSAGGGTYRVFLV